MNYQLHQSYLYFVLPRLKKPPLAIFSLKGTHKKP